MSKGKSLLWLGLLALLFYGCNRGDVAPSPPLETTPSGEAQTSEVASPPAVSEEAQPTPSPTEPEPTPTLEPLIAIVDGQPITLSEYEAELGMYEDAASRELTAEDEERVRDDLIDQKLLAQAAELEGIAVDQTALEERLDQITESIGGPDKLVGWMETYGFDEDTFHRAMERSVNAALMRDEIAARVPDAVEQVHVRQVLFTNKAEAENAYAGLLAGNSFDNLANEYDPVTRGDLGWFPRGYVADEQLEEYAFSLEVDEFSPVFETVAGFHIIMVVERDPQRPLEHEARLMLQVQALEDWLDEQREESEIEVFAP